MRISHTIFLLFIYGRILGHNHIPYLNEGELCYTGIWKLTFRYSFQIANDDKMKKNYTCRSSYNDAFEKYCTGASSFWGHFPSKEKRFISKPNLMTRQIFGWAPFFEQLRIFFSPVIDWKRIPLNRFFPSFKCKAQWKKKKKYAGNTMEEGELR